VTEPSSALYVHTLWAATADRHRVPPDVDDPGDRVRARVEAHDRVRAHDERRASRRAVAAAAAGREHRRERGRDDDRGEAREHDPLASGAGPAADAQRLLGRGDQLGVGPIAVVGILRHRLAQRSVERDRQIGVGRARRRRRILEVRPRDGEARAADEGRRPREALEEKAPEGVHVGAPIDGAAVDLLRRQVAGVPIERPSPACAPCSPSRRVRPKSAR
jgi:hypothetical protein